MKRSTSLMFLCGIVVVATTVVALASAMKQGKIRYSRPEYGRLLVNGAVYTEKGRVKYSAHGWLGCTFYYRGETYDQEAIAVYGNFGEQFFDYSGFEGGRYTVALWGRRVERENCRRARGGCSYCRKHGYHLEQQLGRRTGNLSE